MVTNISGVLTACKTLLNFYQTAWFNIAGNSHLHTCRHEGDLNTIIFNPVASTIPKWLMFKLLRQMQNLCQSMWNDNILYTDRSSKDEQLIKNHFCEKPKIKCGWQLKVKIHILFYG
jgi:hypothetical protein